MDSFILRKDPKSLLEYSRGLMNRLLQYLKNQDLLDRVDRLSMTFRMGSRSELQDHNLNSHQHQDSRVHNQDSNNLVSNLHP